MKNPISTPFQSNASGYDPNAQTFIPASNSDPNANSRPRSVPGSVMNTDHTSEQLILQTAVNNPSEQSQIGLLESLQRNGFRTDVASTGARSTVLTNFLSIKQRPTTLFVYSLEFIKRFDDHDKPVSVKHKFDRQGLFDSMVNDHAYAQLKQNTHKWVTDFYNI